MGLTLTELGEQSDCTASYLSQVERELIEPSISSLKKIAKVLRTPVYKFLLEEEEVGSNFLIRKKDRKCVESTGNKTQLAFLSPLSKEEKNLSIVSMEVTMKPFSLTGLVDSSVHNAEELIIILSGKLEVTIEEKSVDLYEGDSLYIKANVPHSYRNTGESEMRLICCISPAIY
jgi:quercetin dioxygenase-like cupin family protein